MEGIRQTLRRRRAEPALGTTARRRQAVLESGAAFLAALQEPDGCWRDFELPTKGRTDATLTAYAGWCLARRPALARLARRSLERAADWLESRARPDGTWGFNDGCLPDSDTTSWALRFLKLSGRRLPPRSLSSLLEFRQPDGGFSAYRPNEEPNQWGRRTHSDVTPVVLSCLQECGAAGGVLEAGLRSVLAERGPRGWPSWWWAGSLWFSTWLNTSFLFGAGRPGEARGADAGAPSSILDRALRLSCRALTGAAPEPGGIEGLLGEQSPEGGWAGAPLITVAPRDIGPRSPEPRGAVPERSGVFTTATVLSFLSGPEAA